MPRIFYLLILWPSLSLHAEALLAPSRTIQITRNANSLPKWDRGYFLSYDIQNNLFALDGSGKLVVETRVLPDQSGVRIQDVAASGTGTFAVTGSWIGEKGHQAFIVWLDASGKVERLIDTGPAAAFRLCFADDGTLWALMRVHDDASEEIRDYDLLWQYDRRGHRVRTAVPRQSFADADFPAKLGLLVASRDRLGLYVDGAQVWVELSNTGEILGRWKFPGRPASYNADINGLALTPSGDVYVARSVQRGHSDSGLYRFDKTAGIFQKIDTTAVTGTESVWLAGVDGDKLVLSVWRSSALQWAGLQ